MNDRLVTLLKDKPIVVPRILFNNYLKLGITEEEFIVVILLNSYGDKIVYNPEEFSVELGISKHQVMKIINGLVEKNIISIVIETNNQKKCEYLSMDLLYDKLCNKVLGDTSQGNQEVDDSIFSVFENELGRTLSPMEYETIKEWITSGNSPELITCALKEAVINGVSNLRYIDSILNDWKKKGYKKKEDIKRDKDKYHEKKAQVNIYETDWLNE